MKRAILLPPLLLLATAPVLAQGGQFSASGPGTSSSKQNIAIDQVAMIYGLVRYGLDNGTPLALVTAAQMLMDRPVTASDQQPQVQAPERPPADIRAQSEVPRVRLEPLPLLTHARGMSLDDGNLRSLIDVMIARSGEGARGAEGGPVVRYGRLLPGYAHRYDITFQGNQPARVVVAGDGRTNFDCYAYAQDGSLVDSDENGADACILDWWENWTGVVRVEIRGHGGLLNDYILVTN